MDWKKYRLAIGGGVFVVLLGLTVWLFKQRSEERGASVEGLPTLPDVEADEITELEIRRPRAGQPIESVKLAKKDGKWRVAEPVDARADEEAVKSALEKLEELEVEGVAARRAANHERLEVVEGKGVRVIAKRGDTQVADLWIGATRGSDTMVRVEGQEVVAAVSGSIRWVFDKELRDWRDRVITKLEASRLSDLAIAGPGGTFHFVNDGSGWRIADGEAAIDRFAPNKVQSLVESLSNLQAADFAKSDVPAAQSGLAEEGCSMQADAGASACPTTLRLIETIPDAGAPTTTVLRVGAQQAEGDRHTFVRKDGDETLFLVASYLASRMRPSVSEFQTPADGGAEPAAEMPSMPAPGTPMNGNELPPEIMQQIQEQMRAQGLGGP